MDEKKASTGNSSRVRDREYESEKQGIYSKEDHNGCSKEELRYKSQVYKSVEGQRNDGEVSSNYRDLNHRLAWHPKEEMPTESDENERRSSENLEMPKPDGDQVPRIGSGYLVTLNNEGTSVRPLTLVQQVDQEQECPEKQAKQEYGEWKQNGHRLSDDTARFKPQTYWVAEKGETPSIRQERAVALDGEVQFGDAGDVKGVLFESRFSTEEYVSSAEEELNSYINKTSLAKRRSPKPCRNSVNHSKDSPKLANVSSSTEGSPTSIPMRASRRTRKNADRKSPSREIVHDIRKPERSVSPIRAPGSAFKSSAFSSPTHSSSHSLSKRVGQVPDKKGGGTSRNQYTLEPLENYKEAVALGKITPDDFSLSEPKKDQTPKLPPIQVDKGREKAFVKASSLGHRRRRTLSLDLDLVHDMEKGERPNLTPTIVCWSSSVLPSPPPRYPTLRSQNSESGSSTPESWAQHSPIGIECNQRNDTARFLGRQGSPKELQRFQALSRRNSLGHLSPITSGNENLPKPPRRLPPLDGKNIAHRALSRTPSKKENQDNKRTSRPPSPVILPSLDHEAIMSRSLSPLGNTDKMESPPKAIFASPPRRSMSPLTGGRLPPLKYPRRKSSLQSKTPPEKEGRKNKHLLQPIKPLETFVVPPLEHTGPSMIVRSPVPQTPGCISPQETFCFPDEPNSGNVSPSRQYVLPIIDGRANKLRRRSSTRIPSPHMIVINPPSIEDARNASNRRRSPRRSSSSYANSLSPALGDRLLSLTDTESEINTPKSVPQRYVPSPPKTPKSCPIPSPRRARIKIPDGLPPAGVDGEGATFSPSPPRSRSRSKSPLPNKGMNTDEQKLKVLPRRCNSLPSIDLDLKRPEPSGHVARYQPRGKAEPQVPMGMEPREAHSSRDSNSSCDSEILELLTKVREKITTQLPQNPDSRSPLNSKRSSMDNVFVS